MRLTLAGLALAALLTTPTAGFADASAGASACRAADAPPAPAPHAMREANPIDPLLYPFDHQMTTYGG
ncbi:MAG TPA: hypothetical protein VMD91_05335 [Candidatus Sulfotelmatobacter sp.]|nr:hypothetical protein [Candidatus Sulfotelmatobacter sp.]